MIKWLTRQYFTCFIHYMNQHFLTNLLNKWFNDKYILTIMCRHLMVKQCNHQKRYLKATFKSLIFFIFDGYHQCLYWIYKRK